MTSHLKWSAAMMCFMAPVNTSVLCSGKASSMNSWTGAEVIRSTPEMMALERVEMGLELVENA